MQTSLPARRSLVLSADSWLWRGLACVWAAATLWCRAEQISVGCPGLALGLGYGQRGFTLLRAGGLSLACACVLRFFLPAAGTTPAAESRLADWRALHDTTAPFSTSQVEGIITFPSFHACLAVLLAHAMRGLGALSWGMPVLNGMMLFATPAIGCHHLVDVLAGMIVAGLAILAVQPFERRSGCAGSQTVKS